MPGVLEGKNEKTHHRYTATVICASTVLAEPNDENIQILRDEIVRHEMVLDALKLKLKQLEQAVTYIIEISKDSLHVEGKEVSMDKLISDLKELSPDSSVLIKAPKDIPYKRVAETMAFGKKISEISKCFW